MTKKDLSAVAVVIGIIINILTNFTTSENTPNVKGEDDSISAIVETLLIFLRCMNEGVDLSSFIKSG